MTALPRVALVTGGADGIGWATAQRLARDGLRVVVADRQADAARQRAAELDAEFGAGHDGQAVDVSDAPAVAALVAAVVARHGRIDVLVNNAGIGEQPGDTLAQEAEAFDRVLAVHLRGTFVASREVARVMLAQAEGGSIVNLASIAGMAGIPTRNAYGAAKAGIVSLTRAMACEWARRSVRVNAVAPGYVRTALVQRLAQQGMFDVARIEARTPLGRLAEPGEVAGAIAFLASSSASFITGTTLAVDGGWLALGAPESVLASADLTAD